MTQLEAPFQTHSRPVRARHSSGSPDRFPLYVWPIAAMVLMLPVLAILVTLLVT